MPSTDHVGRVSPAWLAVSLRLVQRLTMWGLWRLFAMHRGSCAEPSVSATGSCPSRMGWNTPVTQTEGGDAGGYDFAGWSAEPLDQRDPVT